MEGAKFSPLLLAICALLVGGATAAPRGAKTMMRQGDALSRLILDPADLKKKPPSTTVADGQTLLKQSTFEESSRVLQPQQGMKEKDKIVKLPGQPADVDFDQYGGYVTVDERSGRALFYYFTESPDAASKKPLLLWLNGGPGCSSLGYGAMEELGPFRVKSDGKTLYRNPYAWNRVANVLFLESPAGVGFSYSNTTSDYNMSGDGRSAEDAYAFLVNWLERFPEYKARDFYIAGESYAGHYVPQLAHTVLHYNRLLLHSTVINLKGIAIGNAAINYLTDNKGMFDFFWTHALISDETHRNIDKYCDFTSKEGTENEKCQISLNMAQVVDSEVDIYNIYAPQCLDGNLTAVPKRASIKSFDPCSDYYVDAYLNDPEVQEALHANVTKLGNRWSACTDLPAWRDSADTILPLLRDFMENGLRVWVYSGDIDGRVPVTGSLYSVNALNLTLKTPWQPWVAAGEVGGYSEVYKGDITMATVRGAGHTVPSNQALPALVMIRAFLEGKPLPPLTLK